MTVILNVALCTSCTHKKLFDNTCDAFPNGIPMEILAGADHRTPVDGDRGVVYEQAPGAFAARARRKWKPPS